jgi:CBS domain-containing protein
MLARDIVDRRADPPRPAPDHTYEDAGLPAAHGLDRYGPQVAADALVAEAMAMRVTVCGPDADLAEVAEIMLAHDVREVHVVADGDLLGVVTDRDLLRTMLRPDPPHRPEPSVVAVDHVWLSQPLEPQPRMRMTSASR